MPAIKFLVDWRDFKAQDVTEELSSRICDELISANLAELYEVEEAEKMTLENSLSFKKSSLRMCQTMKEYHLNEAAKLEEKEEAIVEEIKAVEKALKKPKRMKKLKIKK